jgi:FKBP-type peptidyl-prolyl cis-trans isomerase SlyD
VAPEEGYGVHHAQLMQEVPIAAFQGVDDIQPGMQFQGRGPQGEINVTVSRVEGDKVFIDGNHPLAGKTLHFAIEVTGVRAATDEELAHGHVHGAGGHHH